ncbi:MAG: energy transducer TonB [Flavobacterium sp.]
MKKFLILILICCVQNTFSQTIQKGDPNSSTIAPPVEYNPSNAQTVIQDDNQIYNTTGLEVKPEFPGGIGVLNSFLKQNYKKTQEAQKGKIYATFIIEKDGSLSDIKILRDLGNGSGAEAIRVLKLAPKWTPGKQNNKIVRVLYSIPIVVD